MTPSQPNRVTLALATAVALTGGTAACVQPNDDPHPVSRALPTADDVRIKLPESAGANTFTIGQLAEWYVATRGVTRTLNGGTASVLILVHAIVQFPPTTIDGATYTWGPHHDALDPAEWQLVVTEAAAGTYAWHLDGRSRLAAAAPFETLIAGDAHDDGTGHFDLDLDASERVNPIDNDGRGQIGVTYDVAARAVDMAIDTVEDRAGTPTAVHYDYTYGEAADGAGDMVFSIFADTADLGPAPEEATLRSRWLATGAGRADARLRGGDTGAAVTASECWDPMFRRVFYADSAIWQPTEGAVTACAFADQDLP